MLKKFKAYWARFKKTILTKRMKWVLSLGALFLVLFTARAEYVLWRADKILTEKGFASLAGEMLYPYRHLLIYQEKGCRVMLTAFFEGRLMDRADWAAQACLEAGTEIPEAYIALAGVREATGRQEEALGIYQAAIRKFPKDASILFKSARLFLKANMGDEAEKNFIAAATEVPQNIGVQVDTLAFLVQRRNWTAARVIADRVRSSGQALKPQVNIVMAETYLKTSDVGSAQDQIKAASASWKAMSKEMRGELTKIAPEAVARISSNK